MHKITKAFVALGASLALAFAGAGVAQADETNVAGNTDDGGSVAVENYSDGGDDQTITAEGGYTITIDNSEAGHTYEAYQIFTGSLGSDDQLGNIDWGDGVNGKAVIAALNKADPSANYTDAASVANAMNDTNKWTFSKVFGENLTTVDYTSTGSNPYTIAVPAAGYYLVRDTPDSMNGKNDAATAYIMEVVKDVQVSPKSSTPSVTKQVQDETTDAATGADSSGWGNSADHAIGESFQFRLTATLPADAARGQYPAYQMVFNDTMSNGVTFEKIDSVTVNGTTIPTSAYTATATENQAGGSWKLTIPNVLPYLSDPTAAATVQVLYSAHLNSAAQVLNASGTVTNQNTVDLQYSNSPYVSGSLGQTPESAVYVSSFEVKLTKTDGSKPLAGAEFNLEDSAGNVLTFSYDSSKQAYIPDASGSPTLTSAADTGAFNVAGLDAGTYKLTETKTPDGYNTADPVTLTISATHSGNQVTLSSDSTMSETIIDTEGVQLPSTGGIGTTIFTVVGALIIVAAGVGLFIATRRRNAASTTHVSAK